MLIPDYAPLTPSYAVISPGDKVGQRIRKLAYTKGPLCPSHFSIHPRSKVNSPIS